MIYLLKLNEKSNEYKLKVTWNLIELKSIAKVDEKLKQKSSTGAESVRSVHAVELSFKVENDTDSLNRSNDGNDDHDNRKIVWCCDNEQERNDFIDCLWKLSEQFLKTKDRPKFINYQFASKFYFKDRLRKKTFALFLIRYNLDNFGLI